MKPRKGPAYIQTAVDDPTFLKFNEHRKAVGENWHDYIIGGLELRMAQLSKRAKWREQKQRQKASASEHDAGKGER